jgi:two-component system sensor histidine kinase TctE
MSLFGEILDWMLAPMLIVLPVSIAVTYLTAEKLANKPFDQALEDNVRALAAQVRVTPQGRVQFNLPTPALDVLQSDEADRKLYQVLGLRGEYLSGDRSLPVPPEGEEPTVDSVRVRDDSVQGEPIRVAYSWVQLVDSARLEGGNRLVLIQVGETLIKREQHARDVVIGVLFPQFLVLPLTVLLVYLGLTRGLRPLSRLQERIRERRPDDLRPLEEYTAPEEVRPLVQSLNGLMGKLNQTLLTQKRFIADAAHQMKTPLAGLRTQAELAMRQTDPAELKNSLKQLVRSTQRATHVINQLLALARTERAGASMPLQSINLVQLARQAAQDHVPAALDKAIDLGFEADDAAPAIRGHAVLIKELINNLLDNALAYTPRGGTVTVCVQPGLSGRQAELLIDDSGPGIAPAERERVFDAFYRSLDTQHSNADGSGLGLAIVKEIANQHDATIRVEYNPQQTGKDLPGARVSVSFPAQDAAAQEHTGSSAALAVPANSR